MISSDETIAKFCACFGFSMPDFQRRKKQDENIYIEMGLNVPAFIKMLIKNDMEEYTELLLLYWHMQTIYSTKLSKPNIQTLDSTIMTSSEYCVDLTKTLIFLLDEKEGKNTSITFQKSRNSITTREKYTFEIIKKALINEYKIRNFNLTNITFEEAKDELLFKFDVEWIVDNINEILSLNPQIKSEFEIEDEITESNYHEIFDYLYDDYMVEKYADEHYTAQDITLEFLNNKLEALIPQTKKKVGAKPKNSHIAVIAKRLSYLKRIDRFIENKNAIDIDIIKLTNKDYRFIHDFLAFLNLIEDYSIKENTTTTPEKYIYTLLKQTTPDELKYSNVKSRIIETRNKLHEQST